MKQLGLSGEAILALLSGYLINNYAALGVVSSFDFSVREITILGVMLGVSHSLIIEAAIIKRIKVNTLPSQTALPLLVGQIFGLTYGAGVIIQVTDEEDISQNKLLVMAVFLAIGITYLGSKFLINEDENTKTGMES
ncbi:hypothetical protein [Sporohalobacter salinus]|uniref:hypothetical protein n=1 Tax=Sporohalobacter salinus TaxID=1494606 RepID=UPI00195FBF7E|nr:hypothetical protein [Sporohalobacter salinus]MBM7622725.1 hypothetical protein [Sporohalobacter salinus]